MKHYTHITITMRDGREYKNLRINRGGAMRLRWMILEGFEVTVDVQGDTLILSPEEDNA